MSNFNRKNLGARYLIGNNLLLITWRIKIMYLLFSVHGKSMLRVFVQKLGIFYQKSFFFEKNSKHDKISYYLTYFIR